MANTESSIRGVSSAKALIAEDDTTLFLEMEEELRDLGFSRISHAAAVDDALAIIEQDKPDVAILDVNLAGDQVFPVAEKLADIKVPFFFITGNPPETVPEEWAGSVVLQKPVHPPRLRAAIMAALNIGNEEKVSSEASPAPATSH